jgi:hypothetical protein
MGTVPALSIGVTPDGFDAGRLWHISAVHLIAGGCRLCERDPTLLLSAQQASSGEFGVKGSSNSSTPHLI